MTRSKIILFVILASVGTLAMVLYAATVLPAAPSSFQLAILIFTGIAAVVGFLGLIVSYLTYRLEAGRVPRPDLAIRQPDGTWAKSLSLDAAFLETPEGLDGEVELRRKALDSVRDQSRPVLRFGEVLGFGHQLALERFQKDVDNHLREFREYLEMNALWESFWRRSYIAVFGVTNDKAGVPASGIKIAVHFPEQSEGIRVLRLADLPDRPVEPERPSPPRPDATFGLGMDLSRLTPPVPHIDFPDIRRPGNVSGPEIGNGSVLVTYTVQELLHNTIETTEDDPIVISFLQPGKWTIPYEIHARNLPTPESGTLTIEVTESEAAPSYEPAEDKNDNVTSEE